MHGRRDAYFDAARDLDRQTFNRKYGASLMTEERARALLNSARSSIRSGYRTYAPIDFGRGLRVGPAGRTDSGTGRWEFFVGQIVGPLVAGRSVLDLGCHNGSMSLMMVRAGARRVVGIEREPETADFARVNGQVLQWRDIRPYSFDVITGDMRLFLRDDVGEFDVVTAFCSLYYLPPDDMGRVVEKAAAMRATLVLQANDGISNLPASTECLRDLMKAHGYADVRVHAAPGFNRPLLIGRPAAL